MPSKVFPEGEIGPADPARQKHPLIIYNLAACATVGGALFGYDTGIINGANLLVKEEFGLSDSMIELIVSSAVGAAALFSLASGVISDAIGRKTSIMVAAMVFTCGGFLMGLSNGPWMLLVGRFTVGAAIGIVSSVVPVYVSECSPANIRGCLVTLNQLFITLGIWISAILAALFQDIDNGWRYMLGLASIPGLIQFVCFLGLPESPRWQVMKKKLDQAEKTLMRIRDSQDVSEELQDIVISLEEEEKTKVEMSQVRLSAFSSLLFVPTVSHFLVYNFSRPSLLSVGCLSGFRHVPGWRIWTGILKTPHIRYALFVGCMLQVFQQFCGINTVIYYSSNILKSAGFDVRLAIWLSVIPFTVNFLATFIGLWAVEALGRTKVLAASYIAIAVALWVLVAAFLPQYIDPPATSKVFETNITGPCPDYSDCWDCVHDADCSFCGVKDGLDYVKGSCLPAGMDKDADLFSSEGRCSQRENSEDFVGGADLRYTHGYCPSKYAWLAVVGLILFVLGFAPGAGPMPWTINAEIYPLWCRSVANSLATVCNWACNFLVSNLFLTVTHLITSWGTFLVFSVICLISAAFTLMVVPETKDRTLEETELLFMSKEARKAAQARTTERRSSCRSKEDDEEKEERKRHPVMSLTPAPSLEPDGDPSRHPGTGQGDATLGRDELGRTQEENKEAERPKGEGLLVESDVTEADPAEVFGEVEGTEPEAEIAEDGGGDPVD